MIQQPMILPQVHQPQVHQPQVHQQQVMQHNAYQQLIPNQQLQMVAAPSKFSISFQ